MTVGEAEFETNDLGTHLLLRTTSTKVKGFRLGIEVMIASDDCRL
jgi:hypothetical protein